MSGDKVNIDEQRQAIFIHEMLTDFETEFNKFVRNKFQKTLEIADGFNGSKQKFAHIIFHQFRQAHGWAIEPTMNFDFNVDLSAPFSEKLLRIILARGPSLKCHVERIAAGGENIPLSKTSLKPPPVSKILMRFTRL